MSYITYEVRVYNNGTKNWYLNGELHRVDGPAIECANGDKAWYLKNKRHRTDGPAVEWADGDKEWWINDKQLTEEEFARTNNCDGKVVEIDGVKYKLQEVKL